MPRLNEEQQDSVRDARAQAMRVSAVANEFRQSLARFVQSYSNHVGVTSVAIDEFPEPNFGLNIGFTDVIATFEHAQTNGEIVGAFRLYRHIHHPVEPKLAEFWNFAISQDNRGSWSIGGEWEWKIGVGADVAMLLLRVLHEYFEAIKVA